MVNDDLFSTRIVLIGNLDPVGISLFMVEFWCIGLVEALCRLVTIAREEAGRLQAKLLLYLLGLLQAIRVVVVARIDCREVLRMVETQEVLGVQRV